ncbi:DUF4271 domain-containing protein [Dyadobacter frigoris]|uniref:DUF4271 domain-containing protein n=1 Tax=Dyadobacter frigoris TaxID=2576211 RepID=A0A4U6D429_9BACT|nr:DUF4271 domain-containing protein [Dyadobacter frigoris]TKT92050.1 DUF4271 domain-containing protein [Dyadobacter frigoris]GLU53068.1 hypothetical protein Dfri01_25290 [Dyadobacter frigoris]
MKSIHSLLFLVVTTILLFAGANARGAVKALPPEQFFPVYDYQNDWLVYSNQYKNYVPFSKGINEGTKSVSLYIDLLKNRRYFLLVKTENESYLFLEGALQKKIVADQWLELNIDSLFRIYKKEELLLSIYGNAGIDDKDVLICHKKSQDASGIIEKTASTLINIKPINFSPFGNFSILAMLIILILNAWIFNVNPLAFSRLINPLEFFNNDPREQLSKLNKPYSNTVIFLVIIVSMLMAFMLVFFANNKLNLFSVSAILSEESNLIQFLVDFFMLSAIFFLLTYGKFIFMVLVGQMLNLDKLVETLFLKIIQSSYFFYVALFLLVFMLSLNNAIWLVPLRPYIMFPFLIFYVTRFFTLYVVTKPPASFINLYLFSYLCVIEIIPLIIGIKFAM